MKPTYEELELQLEESQREFRAADATIHNLELKITDMTVQLANAESKCRELAQENVTMNDKMNKLATWPGIEFYSSSWEFCNLDGNDALEFMCDVKTPVTDAFLAEVQAQGLERLAKAWYAIANETASGISISESSRLKYRQRADDVADFANEIRKEAAQ